MIDHRNISTGHEIPTETYSDQPYVVQTDDGAWLCAVTTGAGREGQGGQHVVTMRSADLGRTWSAPVDVEPADGPEASYAVLLEVPDGYPNAGRVYVLYNHNTDNIRQVIADRDAYPDGYCRRVDSLGHYVFKFSDDYGQHWSPQRYEIPLRVMAIDRQNPYGGALLFFWNVGKPFIHEGAAFCSLHKVGGFGAGFFTSNEGVLLKSDNLLAERDPSKVRWETLPDGEIGLRTPPGGGPVSAEQSYVVLSDGSFCAVYRTIDGYPVESYSRDGGHTWSVPQYRCYADGRRMKHPRAANFHWRCEVGAADGRGRYLYWFHNHGGRFIREHPQRRSIGYEDRNPVWFSGGIEVDTPEGQVIRWSQPEIGLYDDDPYVRMSYPDLVREGHRFFVTETQKDKARVHEIPRALLEAMWNQFEATAVAREGLLLELPVAGAAPPAAVAMPRLPKFLERDPGRADYGTKDLRQGFSVELRFRLETMRPGQILLDNRAENGQGFCLQTTDRSTVEIVLNDGRTESRWACDPGVVRASETHHLVAIVDGGPKVISFVIDGTLNDGGEFRQFGWGRYSPHLREVNASPVPGLDLSDMRRPAGQPPQGGAPMLRIAPDLDGEVSLVRLYGRYLLTSEAIGNYRAGRGLG
ncbi:MAG: hypothetical protein GXY76_06510 [Chloroflexi bacterium]|nr:hypothetical protein [Chloroflexota bacterium]